MTPDEAKPVKEYHILSLGAGVQSTTLALMAVRGEYRFDAAIFADTGAEPKAVYRHLEWLIRECEPHFPVLVRAKGNILTDLTKGENSTGQKFLTAPFFNKYEDGARGITRRQCTREYKTDVVERSIRRDVLGLEPRKHIPKNVRIIQYIGMSADEGKRVARVRAVFASSRNATPVFPLFDRWMSRRDCELWLLAYGIPHVVPRSACTFCPFHSDAEWAEMKQEDPESFAQAVALDAAIRTHDPVCFVHSSLIPLDQVEFKPKSPPIEQYQLPGMADECEGMCGT